MKLYPNLMQLKDYTPKNRHWTSGEEVKKISDTLKLEDASDDDLFNYRTLVVSLWDNMIAHTDRDSQRHDNLWEGMMSIAAVLDQKMVERGMEV